MKFGSQLNLSFPEWGKEVTKILFARNRQGRNQLLSLVMPVPMFPGVVDQQPRAVHYEHRKKGDNAEAPARRESPPVRHIRGVQNTNGGDFLYLLNFGRFILLGERCEQDLLLLRPAIVGSVTGAKEGQLSQAGGTRTLVAGFLRRYRRCGTFQLRQFGS